MLSSFWHIWHACFLLDGHHFVLNTFLYFLQSRLSNILRVERTVPCHCNQAHWCGFVSLCSTEDSLVSVVCWLESPSLTCCPTAVWSSSVPGRLMAIPATHNSPLCDMFSHPCKGKKKPARGCLCGAWGASEKKSGIVLLISRWV